ncbi:MAG: formate--tetrahydrofolate ligase [Myxococcales bacterium]|nr:formate--tetrahydrofolate ligase [Myxococcales bacterium]
MKLRPLSDVAADLGLAPEHVIPYGRHKAKVELEALRDPAEARGKLVLVSAINPTKAGEGKTTTSVGLAMGLERIGRRTAVCLREPSLGPVFGIKGGGTGGGVAQIEPATDINLHFTGDLHAITSAHNLLAALVDNELHFGGKSGLDARRVSWPRVLDMNDRALRNVVVGMRGEGVIRETSFDITAASEIMAVLCLAESEEDLEARLARVVVGRRKDRSPVTAGDLGAAAALRVLLRDALRPNLVQTREGTPALVHGGPFANIAHGCSSVLATRMGLGYADVVVTEAGFGFDLGGEKFLDIKCRQAGLWPDLVVLVATCRALKAHGGAKDFAARDDAALKAGLANLDHHLDAIAGFGLRAVVAINRFPSDAPEELAMVQDHCAARGVVAKSSTGFSDGGAGAEGLADAVARQLDESPAPAPRFTYADDAPYAEKIDAIAKRIYGADGAVILPAARRVLDQLERDGVRLPVCMAKTPLSLSDDPGMTGPRPKGFEVTVREARLSAGAGFVVCLLGDVMTMPGLPKEPSAMRVRVTPDGRVLGLMQND